MQWSLLQKCYSIVGMTPPPQTQHLPQKVKRLYLHPATTIKYLSIF